MERAPSLGIYLTMSLSPSLPNNVPATTTLAAEGMVRKSYDFDAGINTSNAWFAEQNDREVCQSPVSNDEAESGQDEYNGRLARALYDFQGKVEFRELTIDAGQELEIIKEVLDDGWSLARVKGEIGLIPQSYYTFTLEMIPGESLVPGQDDSDHNSVKNDTVAPSVAQPVFPLTSHLTGNLFYFPSFRDSLLRGKSFNRFSSFVTTGAEDWILNGIAADLNPEHPAKPSHRKKSTWYINDDVDIDADVDDALDVHSDRHFVEAGPSWKTKLPAFCVMVHSPSKRTSVISGSYTIYHVTSIFTPSNKIEECSEDGSSSPTRVTVHRRFSHFVFLHTVLRRQFPGIALPPLPEKQYAGRFSEEFVEARRGDLERYLARVIRHPIARYADVLTFFLSCENEKQWNRILPQFLNAPPAGARFYAKVYHPMFNVDMDEAGQTISRFERHVKAVDQGVQNMRSIYEKLRISRSEMSNTQRLLSYGLLSLITSTPLSSNVQSGLQNNRGEDGDGDPGRSGLVNDEGAWCWRNGCEDCLKLTKAIQKTADTLQIVADLHDDSARRRQLALHEILKDVAHPSLLYAPVIDTHQSTLSRYIAHETCLNSEEIASRCETVLNTTMAEVDAYHQQKNEDFRQFMTEHLDSEIEFYEQVLTRLRAARETFDNPKYFELATTAKKPSIYERELDNPKLSSLPLPQPVPHVYDSTPMRPVSVAINGMNLILSGRRQSTTAVRRTSVLGKFW